MIIIIYRSIYLPDLFFSLLLLISFIFIKFNSILITSIFNILLWATRESIIIYNLVIIYLSIKYRRFKLIIYIVISSLIGKLISGYFGSLGNPNIHNLNDLFYIIGKIPFNFSKNLLGISLWTDTLSLRHPELFLHSPLYTINVSYLSFIGDIKLIGIYDFNFSPVLDTFFIMLTIFSIMPIVICAILLNFNTRALWQEAPLTIKIATIYGLICFILSPCIG